MQDWVPVEDLLRSKARKNLVNLGATLFNNKPKSGIAFLEENGIIYADLSDEVSRPLSLARFLKSSTRLDKRLLGDYISRPDNLELLKAFISLFDYKNVRIRGLPLG
jgi:brefeldin A-resistance guanine nucleotide exchange factor 1